MTTILGVQHKNGFTMAADSQVSVGDQPFYHSDITKIVTVGEYTIAGAGNARYCDVIAYDWIPPKYDGTNLYTFMVSKVIPSMREAHEKTGYTLKDDEIFLFLIGLENKIFYITEDYTVLMSNTNHYGIGTGAAYGLGALAAGVGIEEATKIAIKLDINSGGKIQIVQQGD